MRVRFRLLGPVDVRADDEPIAIARRQERCLLGILLLEAGHVVPAERLVDLLWDGAPPQHGRRSVQIHIARLKARLPLGPDESLESGRGGYALHLDPECVDAHRFQSLVAAARSCGAPEERADLLTLSLSLWRGALMQDSADDLLRHRIGAPLTTLRLDASEELLAIGLALGRAHDLLPELTRMATEHPDRERFVELRMEALRRLGREVEALEVYQEARRYLVEMLGLDPSPRLQSLHAAILRQEPVAGTGERVVIRSGPAGLPAAVSGFVGRRTEGSARARTPSDMSTYDSGATRRRWHMRPRPSRSPNRPATGWTSPGPGC